MPTHTPKSQSVTAQGEPDGWVPPAGFVRELDPSGATRVVISVDHTHLLDTHVALAEALAGPIGVLYRQVVDRAAVASGASPPQGLPPKDFVALEVPIPRVVDALRRFTGLLHHDARCELWLRGALDEQLVLDADGLLYAYPDDPAFADVLMGLGFQADVQETIVDRDYAKHWFHVEHDADERAFHEALGLVEVAAQRKQGGR